MTEQDRQLLLADLCGRLPYGVKVLIPECRQDAATLIGTDDKCFAVKYGKSTFYCPFHITIKPYLRPMSSMTEEELAEYEKANDLDTLDSSETLRENMKAKYRVRISKWYHGTDWLNAHHFDFRNLIERGLAISTEEYNPYEK